MKNLFQIVLALAFGAQLHAAEYIGSNLVATNTAVVATPVIVSSVTVFSTNTVPTLVRLYDGALTNVTSAYTNYTTYTTNLIVNYVTTSGITNKYTNDVIWRSPNVVAAATNNTTPTVSFVAPAANVPLTITGPWIFGKSVTLSNNLAGLSVIMTYRTQ